MEAEITLVSQALLVTLTLSKPYSFLPCCPKTWLHTTETGDDQHTGREKVDEMATHRYLEARTNRDIVSC